MLEAGLQTVQSVILQIPGLLTQPSSRFFWVFCLSSVLMAMLVLSAQYRFRFSKRLLKAIRLRIFNSKIWLSRATLVDLTSFSGNALIKVVCLAPLLGSQLAFALVVARFLQSNFDSAPALNLPVWAIAAIFSLTFFIFEDLSRFLLHYCMHRVPLLWHFHRFHHSATVLTPLTLMRVHPVEMTLYYCRAILVFGIVSGIFIYLFGKDLSAWQILGVDALGFLFNFFAANLRHSNVWMTFGILEPWLISPAQHQIHHSSDAKHRDKNFGACLTVWDRWMGTHFSAPRSPLKLRFGLASQK